MAGRCSSAACVQRSLRQQAKTRDKGATGAALRAQVQARRTGSVCFSASHQPVGGSSVFGTLSNGTISSEMRDESSPGTTPCQNS